MNRDDGRTEIHRENRADPDRERRLDSILEPKEIYGRKT